MIEYPRKMKLRSVHHKMKNHYQMLKNYFFQNLDQILTLCKNRLDPDAFEFEMRGYNGLKDPGHFGGLYSWLLFGYYLPDSPHYHDTELLECAVKILETYKSYLHEDGSVDLIETNFHDPAQTGFHVKGYFAATEILAKFTEHTELEEKLYAVNVEILSEMGEAMSTLGFHTPNHRWVISAALSIAYKYTKNPQFLDTINRFLMEGIDCDENGEYTERSTGSYNLVCNHSFTLLAYFMNDKSFLDYPRRNLNLMYSFTEPDLSVNTLNSTRWDQGGQYTIAPYYPFYVMLALLDNNPEFAYMADTISEHFPYPQALGIYLPDLLSFFMLFPEMEKAQETLVSKAPAADQTHFYPNTNIARIYKPEHNMTMTVIGTRHPVFFQMNYGASILQVRFAGSFFGDPHSQFRAREIVQTEDGFRLICDESAGYRSQLDEKPETSDWRRMDHSKRKIINVQNFHTEITVHLTDDGATFDIETSGCENIPTNLEFVMQPGGKLDTDHFATSAKAGDYIFLKDGTARYFLDGRRYFEMGNGFCEHTYAEHMRGAFPSDTSKVTLAMTAVTPQRSTVELHAKKLY